MDYADSSCFVEDFTTTTLTETPADDCTRENRHNNNSRSNNRRRRRRRPEPEDDVIDDVTNESRQQRGQSTACWDGGGEERDNATTRVFNINGNGDIGSHGNDACCSDSNRKQSMAQEMKVSGGHKSKVFSANGLSRFGLIQLALAEEGVVWGLETDILKKKTTTIPYQNIIHARKSRNNDKFCIYYVEEENQRLIENDLEVELSQEGECRKWVKYITKILRTSFKRPKNLRVYISKQSGKGNGAAIFAEKAEPVLSLYRVQFDIVEISGQEDLKEDFSLVDWREKQYDAVVAVGGDRTVSIIVDALLRQSLSEKGVNKHRAQFVPVAAKLPIAILPTGFHNDIATSVMGTSDFTTAVLHLMLGNRVYPDVASVFAKDRLVGWSFNCQYGFMSNVHGLMEAFKIPTMHKLEASLVKTLSKKRLITYESDIQFLPANNTASSHPKDNVMCIRGCSVCKNFAESQQEKTNTSKDEVEDVDVTLNDSFNSNSFIELKNNTTWQSVKGSFLWAGLHSVSCRNELVPLGFSQFSHLQDGTMDLVLVYAATKKDFMRFIRRHGNGKNQLDLPFVECHRVQAVRFHQRIADTWRHRDVGKSEIDYHLSGAARISSGLASNSSASSFTGGTAVASPSLSGRMSVDFASLTTGVIGDRSKQKRRPEVEDVMVIDDFQDESSEEEIDDQPIASQPIRRTGKQPIKQPRPPIKMMTRPPLHLSKSSSLCALDSAEGLETMCRAESETSETGGLGSAGYTVTTTPASPLPSQLSPGDQKKAGARKASLTGLKLKGGSLFGSLRNLSKSEDISEGDDASKRRLSSAVDSSSDKNSKTEKKKSGLRRLSLMFSLKTTEAPSKGKPPRTPEYVKPRQTISEIERDRRLAKARKKEDEDRRKEEEKSSCSWVLDYNRVKESDLEFNVHSNLLEIFGNGIFPGSKVSENKMIWLPSF